MSIGMRYGFFLNSKSVLRKPQNKKSAPIFFAQIDC
jgi:hypothetical protein